ncbi:MAG: BamA/OMP85 family outer membrane protein [Ignavibacteriaceae bacterium]
MFRLISFSLLLLFTYSFVYPQTVESIQINENHIFSQDNVLRWCQVSTGTKIFPGLLDSIKTRLALHFGEEGYFHAEFQGSKIELSPDSQHVKLIIKIDEGEPTYVKKIFLTGLDTSSDNNIFSSFNFLENHIYSKSNLEENIISALSYFQNNGYPFAKIIISSIYFYSDSTKKDYFADIHITVNKERFCRIDKIEIAGNNKTQSYVIQRELRLKPGEVYSQKVIDDLPSRLNRLGFFEPVGNPKYFVNSKNHGILRIEVKEKVTNNFDGIIGYIPSTIPNQSGYLTGLVDVSLSNLFGTGRAAAIHWQQYNRSSQDLQLKYLEPWLFGYPFNLNLSLFQRQQDSTYVQRTVEASLEYLATDIVSASVFISTDAVIPTDNGSQIFTVYNSTSVTTGLNIKVDTRDDPYAPTRGILFLNSYSFSKKTISGPGQFFTPDLTTSINLQRLTLDIGGYYELFDRQVIALGIHGRELRGQFFENSDLFRLGGASSLRGYTESQFLGNRVMWTNLEFRSLLTKRSFVFLFLDTGYYLRNADPSRNILRAEGFNVGYGLGMNIETGLGVLSVSFALAKGDSFSNGKIHFGIVNQF